MLERFLDLQTSIKEVTEEMKYDCLYPREWIQLQNIKQILEPFKIHTDILQTDTSSLCNVLPCIFDLMCHLENLEFNQLITKILYSEMKTRFNMFIMPSNQLFDPIPAACCLM